MRLSAVLNAFSGVLVCACVRARARDFAERPGLLLPSQQPFQLADFVEISVVNPNQLRVGTPGN